MSSNDSIPTVFHSNQGPDLYRPNTRCEWIVHDPEFDHKNWVKQNDNSDFSSARILVIQWTNLKIAGGDELSIHPGMGTQNSTSSQKFGTVSWHARQWPTTTIRTSSQAREFSKSTFVHGAARIIFQTDSSLTTVAEGFSVKVRLATEEETQKFKSCSNHGRLRVDEHGWLFCQCNVGWFGSDCSEREF